MRSAVVAVCIAALGSVALAQAEPSADLAAAVTDIGTKAILGMFSASDLAVMAGIATLTFFLDRTESVSDHVTALLPMAAGAAWGVLDTLGTPGAEPVAAFVLARSVARGAVLNGAVAAILGVVIQRTLARLAPQKDA